MDDSIKYLIHARIVADGVVDRTDVVGAVFGQTEGLLGNELEIRGLQESAKLGRIDVEIETENGQSFGTLTIGSALDKAETAILGAALETIDRVGPCTADIEVTAIEDVRAAKRREVVERAKELLIEGFNDASLTSTEIIEEVRESAQPGTVTEYEDLPAGPGVQSSDAIILVEGRADVRRLVEAGINNVVAVEGTNIPDAIIDITEGRTTTAFLDGDRGGDLILRELAQVASVDYVARAPKGKAVEDLSGEAVTSALRTKQPMKSALANLDEQADTTASARPDGSVTPDIPSPPPDDDPLHESDHQGSPAEIITDDGQDDTTADSPVESADPTTTEPTNDTDETPSVQSHAAEIIGNNTNHVRFLDPEGSVITEDSVETMPTLLETTTPTPSVIIIDDSVGPPLADIAAENDVDRIVAADRGEFVKQPATVRIHTNTEVQQSELPPDATD